MKIKQIQISNYRAFLVNGDHEAKRYTIDLPNGENLLVYGENGSGKSSLFKALQDFFISALNNGKAFQKNLFYEAADNQEQPFIDVVTEDSSHHRFSADGNQYILMDSIPGSNTNYISQATVVNGFISYRDLLKLHFRPNKQEPDLFALFFGEEGLFSDMNVPTPEKIENKLSFKDLWKKCLLSDLDAINDYNTNVSSLFKEMETRANMLLAFFQKECKLTIEYTGAQAQKKTSLSAVILPQISFKVTLFDKEIPRHDDMLNEARLTSLAISVFLAHQLCLPSTDLQILFLDDIFIGLDMSNRIPLIKILTSQDLGDGTSFKNFQIFLTTYDRDWFNVAKTYLTEGWHKIEFYVDDNDGPIERPLIRNSETYIERAKFHFIQSDYPASANYLRKAFEQALRAILPENVLYIGLGGNSESKDSQVTVSKQQLSIKENEYSWSFLPKPLSAISGLSPRPANLNKLIDLFKKLMNDCNIPFPYLEELPRLKNRLLNPLSHDDLRSPVFKTELKSGFLIFEELLKVKSKILFNISAAHPVFLYFDQTDSAGIEYRYKFQLMENLRYIEYGGNGKLLNAECKPISRILKSSGVEEAGLGGTQKSISSLCKGICIHSAAPENKKAVVFNETSLINVVLTETGESLANLI